MLTNLRLAFRALAKSPGFTLVALVTLALGIGLNTSMFSVVNVLLFRSAPYPDADRLVLLKATTRAGEQRFFSEQEIREITPATDAFSSLTTFSRISLSLAEPGRPAERVAGIVLSRGMLDTFATQPIHGRTFAAEEFEPGKNQVVLLNEAFWLSRFGGDRSVIGRTLRLDGETVTIIGVMPARFDYRMLWGNVALIRPLNFTSDQVAFRAYRSFQLLGRLKPGVTSASAVGPLATVAATQEKSFPQDYAGMRYSAVPLHAAIADSVTRGISWMLVGLAAFVLLICCANLANLQLARATASAREFAIRAALGASRTRLIVQQLTESLVLSAGGGILGVVVALWVNDLLERSILIDGMRGLDIPLDGSILAVTLLVSLLTGVTFGVAPALFASRSDVNATLKSQTRGATASRGQNRLRHALIIAEVAFALVLLGGAAVMNRGFSRMLERHVGWDTDRVLSGFIALPEARYDNPKRIEFFRRVEEKLAALPGVESAALANALPLFGFFSDRPIFRDAPSAGAEGGNPVASHVLITPSYLPTLGLRLIEGRNFPPDLKFDGPAYILVNQALARRFFPDGNAVGQRLGVTENNETVWREIIGVVSDVEPAASIVDPATPYHVFRPLVQEPWSGVSFAVRSAQPAALIETVRRAIAEIDPDVPADQVATVPQFVGRMQHNLVIVGHMLTGFAALGLVLAAVGLYGVISHLVAQRTGEFGIRLALGAQPRDLLLHVLGNGARLAAGGLVLGVAGAFALGGFLTSFMPRLVSTDPLGILGVAGLLLLVALLACWVPARRATKVDPIAALRSD